VWDRVGETQARDSLRHALSEIENTGSWRLAKGRNTVRLDTAPCWIDVFEKPARTGPAGGGPSRCVQQLRPVAPDRKGAFREAVASTTRDRSGRARRQKRSSGPSCRRRAETLELYADARTCCA